MFNVYNYNLNDDSTTVEFHGTGRRFLLTREALNPGNYDNPIFKDCMLNNELYLCVLDDVIKYHKTFNELMEEVNEHLKNP